MREVWKTLGVGVLAFVLALLASSLVPEPYDGLVMLALVCAGGVLLTGWHVERTRGSGQDES